MVLNNKENNKDKNKSTKQSVKQAKDAKAVVNLYIGKPQKRIDPIKIVYFFIGFVIAVGIGYLAYWLFLGFGNPGKLADVVTGIKQEKYKEVVLNGNTVTAIKPNGDKTQVKIENNTSFLELLQRDGIKIEDLDNVNFKVESTSATLIDWIGIGTDLMFLLIVAWFAARFVNSFGGKGGVGDPLKGFGASKAQLITPDKVKVRFKDVAGLTEVKEEVVELVEFLKNPKSFWKMGARIPKGVLLEGPPGTGKTMVAKAIAGEAKVPFLYTSGSAFEEMLVGTGASRVRDLFAKARALAPCIIFIDEIDAVAKRRGVDFRSSYGDQTLNQLLVEMDGMKENSAVIVMAATNRADLLDPALLRPGRFDRKVTFHLPHLHEREAILKVHAQNKPLSKDIDLHEFAVATIGLSGAQIENLLNEAAILAVRAKRKEITNQDMWEALSRISLGPARRFLAITKDELLRTAYHEAGHAIVAVFSDGGIPVQNISIIPRGHALGITSTKEEVDTYNRTYRQLLSHVSMAYGGYMAEVMKFGNQDVSSGAISDIQMASRILRTMVRNLGMGENLGLVYYGFDSDFVEFNFLHNYSDATARDIDKEIIRLSKHAQETAKKILERESVLLEKVAYALLQKETLSNMEFYKLVEKYAVGEYKKPESKEIKSVHDWISLVRQEAEQKTSNQVDNEDTTKA